MTGPGPVKLVASVFSPDKGLLHDTLAGLEETFGPVDMISEPLALATGYYEEEFGTGVARKVIAFEELAAPGRLVEVKNRASRMEDETREDGRRRVNIDPGYVTLANFVLASGKPYSHRVYLADGVYADLQFVYRDGGFRELPWTYPDYASEPMKGLVTEARRRLAFQTGKGRDGA